MENDTWIKLYRKLLQSPIFENEKALKIWIWCLLKATHTDRKQLVGLQVVELKNGQFIFGRNKASEELKMNESTIYKYIKLLEELQMISINSNNKFSVISIEKWEDYQLNEIKNNNKVTTKEQQSNTNKNVKNVNNNIYKEIESFTQNSDLINSINEFVEYRKQKKKELTQLALKKILNQFKKWNYTDEECIESINISIMRGWTGIFELKDRKPITQNNVKQEYMEIDTSRLTQEEYGKLMRNEITIEELIEKGKINE